MKKFISIILLIAIIASIASTMIGNYYHIIGAIGSFLIIYGMYEQSKENI